jgi:hypothetical protein
MGKHHCVIVRRNINKGAFFSGRCQRVEAKDALGKRPWQNMENVDSANNPITVYETIEVTCKKGP